MISIKHIYHFYIWYHLHHQQFHIKGDKNINSKNIFQMYSDAMPVLIVHTVKTKEIVSCLLGLELQ